MPDSVPEPANRILICNTCDRPAGAVPAAQAVALIRRALAAAGLDDAFGVVETSCLGGCDAPVCLAVQGQGRAAYLFADLTVETVADDIAAFSRLYLDAGDGWIVDARPAGQLRFHLRARIPALAGPSVVDRQ